MGSARWRGVIDCASSPAYKPNLKNALASTISGWFFRAYYCISKAGKTNGQTTFSKSSRAANFILGKWCGNVLIIDCQHVERNPLYNKTTFIEVTRWNFLKMEFPRQGFHFQILARRRKWLWILKWPAFHVPTPYLLTPGLALCLSWSPPLHFIPISWVVLKATELSNKTSPPLHPAFGPQRLLALSRGLTNLGGRIG